MVLKMGQLCESLAANFAGKRLLSGVNELVPLKFRRRWELFATVDTFMAPVVHRRIRITIGTSGAHLEVQWQTQGEINATARRQF